MSEESRRIGRAYALQTIGWYLRDKHNVNIENINADTKLSVEQTKNFFNRKTSQATRANQATALEKTILKLYDEYNLGEDPFIASLRAFIEDEPSEIGSAPSKSISPDIRNWFPKDDEFVQRVASRLSGIWLLSRLSTTDWDNPEKPEYNVSLIMVPHMREGEEGLPMYRQYVSSKFDGNNTDKFEGYFLIEKKRIHMMARRRNVEKLTAKFLTFRYRPLDEDEELKPVFDAYAQGLLTNSGEVPISSYIDMQLVKSGMEMTSDEITALKDEYIEKIGVFTEDDIIKSDLPLDVKRLERLDQWSKNDQVFRERT